MFKKVFFVYPILILMSIFNLAFSAETFNPMQNTTDVNMLTNTNNKNDINSKNMLFIELKDGIVIAELFPDIAPMHIQRIKALTKEGFYDGLKFHRVIDKFMAQTGDPTGTGRGGSQFGKVYAEFNKEHHVKGTLSMARASDPNSANSQFFIVTGDFFPELDGQYTIFGRVVDGMEYVEKIKVGDTANNGSVENPDSMIKVVTSEMLNNKSKEIILEEIKVINEMQNAKAKENPNYKKKSVLELLIATKDVNINEEDNEVNKTNEVSNNEMPTDTTKDEKKVVNSAPANSNIKDDNKTLPVTDLLNGRTLNNKSNVPNTNNNVNDNNINNSDNINLNMTEEFF